MLIIVPDLIRDLSHSDNVSAESLEEVLAICNDLVVLFAHNLPSESFNDIAKVFLRNLAP
jgi:hypothetical protein